VPAFQGLSLRPRDTQRSGPPAPRAGLFLVSLPKSSKRNPPVGVLSRPVLRGHGRTVIRYTSPRWTTSANSISSLKSINPFSLARMKYSD